MARRLTVDGVDRLGLTQRGSIRLASTAHDGEVGMGGWNTDDDAAAMTFAGLKVARLIEDASGGDKHVWRGRIWLKNLARGDWLMGDARRFAVNVVDSNWDFTKLRVHGVTRPAESDVARVLWLVGYILNGAGSTVSNARSRATTVIGVASYVPNTNLVTMPPRRFDNSDPAAVLDDCIRASGKTFFPVLLDDGTLELFYDLPTSTAYASTLSITDDGTADGITSYAPGADGPSGTQDPSELLSGVGLVSASGAVSTAFDASVEAAYDTAEITTYDQGAIGATAADRATALLAKRGVEEDRYRCFIEVTPARAHLLKAGMTMTYRSAAAGVTAPITVRVERCEPELTLQNLYRLHLELAFPEKVTPRLQSSGAIPVVAGGTPVYSSGAIGTNYWVKMRVWVTAGMDADLLLSLNDVDVTAHVNLSTGDWGLGGLPGLGIGLVKGASILNAAFGLVDGSWHTLFFGIAGASQFLEVDGGARITLAPATHTDWYSSGTYRLEISNNGLPVGDPGGELQVDYVTGSALIDDFNRADPAGWGPGWIHFSGTFDWFVDSAAGHIFNTVTYRLLDTSEPGPLSGSGSTGHDFTWTFTADGILSAWTFPYAFVAGSLAVRVDGNDQNSTEDDPAAGTFHLSWTPHAGDQISVTARLTIP